MRRLLLLTSLSLLAGSYAFAPAYAQGYGNQPPGYKAPPPPAPYTGSNQPAPGYKEPTPQAPYAGSKGPPLGPQLSSSENRGRPGKALRAYRREWNEEYATWRDKRHDWPSHGADAFRYLAMGLPEPAAKQKPITYPKGSYV